MSRFFRAIAPLLILTTATPAVLTAQMTMPACHSMPPTADPGPPAQLPIPLRMTGLGNVHFPISSAKPETQAWFDQGTNLIFDFWDYEADRAFEQAVRTDPNCAICHWGLSEALRLRNDESLGYAHDELVKAIALRSHATEREKLYIDAAQAAEEEHLQHIGENSDTEKKSVTLLRQLVKQYPQDTTAKIMLSDAVQDGYDQGKPRKGTQESISLLQEVLKMEPNNSAANHLWIHAVEPGLHPELALHSAEILASLSPASGHMTHMPGHIFYRTGDYARAQQAFDLSESVDEAYMRDQKIPADDDWNYVHNLMYSIANLMEMGEFTQASVVSAKLPAARGHRQDTLYLYSPRDAVARLNPLLPIALRTGDWSRVSGLLSTASVSDSLPNLTFFKSVLSAFAQGMQNVSDMQLEQAETASTKLDAALWRYTQNEKDEEATKKKEQSSPMKPENYAMPPDPVAEPLLKNAAILSLELRASILALHGNITQSEKLFADAREQESDLGYHEPPAFIRPVAEQEAIVLMAAGKQAEARVAWQHSLEDRPKSGFALYGLAQIAEQSGNTEQTTAAWREFLSEWKSADANLPQVIHAQQWMRQHTAPAAGTR